ncbi:hypothetical protein AMTRI_Chr04g189070 [Amborella trichopoda]
MARRSCNCGMCENANLPSICVACVSYKVHEYHAALKSLEATRDALYKRLNGEMTAKKKGDGQRNWRVLHNEKLAQLKKRLSTIEKQLRQAKAKREKMTQEQDNRDALLKSAFIVLEKNRAEQLQKYYPNIICTQNLGLIAITSEVLHKQAVIIKNVCKLFPQRPVNLEGERKELNDTPNDLRYDQICNARLPRGLDPHSVQSEELAASLGYMVHLVDLVAWYLRAPILHNSGFAGSCSRIWQRNSYWDVSPASQNKEYPLFIPRQNSCAVNAESSNFGVASMESEKKPHVDGVGSISFNYSSASPHSVETHKDLQKGISLLKKSVACITAYCCNTLCLDFPSEMSTFEAFAKLLQTIGAKKEVQSFTSKIACSRSRKPVQQVNTSVLQEQYLINSVTSSYCLEGSAHAPSIKPDKQKGRSDMSFLYTNEATISKKGDCLVEGWDIVEHPPLPPRPSESEDVEHWTRAMFIDATKRQRRSKWGSGWHS